jgi:hypothetical protein
VRVQELPMDRVRKLRTKPATPPRIKPRRIFRIIVSSSNKFTIPWGLNQEPQKTNSRSLDYADSKNDCRDFWIFQKSPGFFLDRLNRHQID